MFRISSKFYQVPHEVLDLVEAARDGKNIFFEGGCCEVKMDYIPTEKEMADILIAKPCELISFDLSKDQIKVKSRNLFFTKKYITHLTMAQYEIKFLLRDNRVLPINVEIKAIHHDPYYNDAYESMSKKDQKKWVKEHADRSNSHLMLI